MQLIGKRECKKRFISDRILRGGEDNSEMRWFHFGDFDPDGFLIIEHLKKKTGIAFQPIHMGLDELEKYQAYGRPMKENDRKKAETLIEKGLYVREMRFMLEQDCKIEQEIVSWMLESGKGEFLIKDIGAQIDLCRK